MKKKVYTAKEKMEVLVKPNLLIKDICILYDCGYKAARKKANLYKEWAKKEAIFVGGKNEIITTEFVRYFHYDENRVRAYARLGF